MSIAKWFQLCFELHESSKFWQYQLSLDSDPEPEGKYFPGKGRRSVSHSTPSPAYCKKQWILTRVVISTKASKLSLFCTVTSRQKCNPKTKNSPFFQCSACSELSDFRTRSVPWAMGTPVSASPPRNALTRGEPREGPVRWGMGSAAPVSKRKKKRPHIIWKNILPFFLLVSVDLGCGGMSSTVISYFVSSASDESPCLLRVKD